MYTQFCKYYREYANVTKATMHIDRKPGELLEVDWAGKTATIIDRNTGEAIDAYVFVAALSSSQYAYVEAFLSMNQESWIATHVNAYQFFGGVTRILVPDNLKTGVEKVSWYTPVINKTYHDMDEHYGTAVIPARVRRPKDKATVEGTVGIISTWIIAALRRQKFFSLRELNEAIMPKLQDFNSKPFQKKPGSRLSVFEEEEQPALLPLPHVPYELATWKIATVQFNYHIAVGKCFTAARTNTSNIKLMFVSPGGLSKSSSITTESVHIQSYMAEKASTARLLNICPKSISSTPAWNSERFISWAKSVGLNTSIAVQAILTSHKVEQQGYRSCMALLKLADKYAVNRLEAACEKALSYTPNPSYKSIQTILKTGHDKVVKEEIVPNSKSANFGFTRGADYYGRNS